MTQHIQRIVLTFLTIMLAACASVPPEPTGPRPTGSGSVEISMVGFKSDDGQALVALFLDPRGWPDEIGPAFAAEVVPIMGGEAAALVEVVPAGPFAVSVFHDLNGDRELDADVLGIPSEAYGFSADARNTFGPPSFEEARLDLAADETKQITIRVK
jgi:uncharacterized protein (DUF2141 family)